MGCHQTTGTKRRDVTSVRGERSGLCDIQKERRSGGVHGERSSIEAGTGQDGLSSDGVHAEDVIVRPLGVVLRRLTPLGSGGEIGWTCTKDKRMSKATDLGSTHAITDGLVAALAENTSR